MELATYLAIVALAASLAVVDRPLTRRLFAFIFASVAIALALVVRFSGFDVDIITYASRMGIRSTDIYYLREPVVWFGHRIAFNAIGSQVAVFVLSDLVVITITAAALKRLRAPQYAFLAVLAFFPFVLGQQNVYRQWVASAFLLYALASSREHKWQMWGALVLAVLSHNAAVLFVAPIVAYGRGKWRIPLLILGAIATPAAILFGSDVKSEAETGLPLEWVYLAIIASACFFLAMLRRGRLNDDARREMTALVFMVYVAGVSCLVLPSAGAERISLMAFGLIWAIGVLAIEVRLKERWLWRSALTIGGFVPILLTGTRQFIL